MKEKGENCRSYFKQWVMLNSANFLIKYKQDSVWRVRTRQWFYTAPDRAKKEEEKFVMRSRVGKTKKGKKYKNINNSVEKQGSLYGLQPSSCPVSTFHHPRVEKLLLEGYGIGGSQDYCCRTCNKDLQQTKPHNNEFRQQYPIRCRKFPSPFLSLSLTNSLKLIYFLCIKYYCATQSSMSYRMSQMNTVLHEYDKVISSSLYTKEGIISCWQENILLNRRQQTVAFHEEWDWGKLFNNQQFICPDVRCV